MTSKEFAEAIKTVLEKPASWAVVLLAGVLFHDYWTNYRLMEAVRDNVAETARSHREVQVHLAQQNAILTKLLEKLDGE